MGANLSHTGKLMDVIAAANHHTGIESRGEDPLIQARKALEALTALYLVTQAQLQAEQERYMNILECMEQ